MRLGFPSGRTLANSSLLQHVGSFSGVKVSIAAQNSGDLKILKNKKGRNIFEWRRISPPLANDAPHTLTYNLRTYTSELAGMKPLRLIHSEPFDFAQVSSA